MAWVAHGSDMGGSLRTAASFCGVVGLRPSPGRLAASPGFRVDETLTVDGPMARCVDDVALLLDAMTGERSGDPRSLPSPERSFLSSSCSGRQILCPSERCGRKSVTAFPESVACTVFQTATASSLRSF